jgi:transketolase N-terminal domain/subunit
MAYYAFLDNDNTVVEVITGNEENSEGVNWEEWYGN